MGLTSKVISIGITSRLQSALNIEGIPTQFGSTPKTGCPDGSFSIRSILQTRKEHDLESWVVFVDLVKAFDTIHHKIIFNLLKKYEIPIYLIKEVEKLYRDFKIEIKVGKKKELIDYSNAVTVSHNGKHTSRMNLFTCLWKLLNRN